MCLPLTSVGAYIADSEVAFASISTTSLDQYDPVQAEVVTLANSCQGKEQPFVIREFRVRETATSSGNLRKKALLVYLYTTTAPTTPVDGAVYNASVTNLLGVLSIAAADYVRISDTVWEARIQPNLHVKSGTTAGSTSMFAVVVSNEATPFSYAASAGITLLTRNEMAVGANSAT